MHGVSFNYRSKPKSMFDRDELSMLLCQAVVLPLILMLFLLNKVLPVSVGDVSPTRWLVTACLPVLIAWYGLQRKSLDLSGAFAGIILSQLLILANYGFLAQLLVFFLAGSRVTRFRERTKRAMDQHFKEGGGRDWWQVLATSLPAALLSALYLLEVGSSEHWLDMNHGYHSTLITAAVLGSLSCANGDTFSSEVGTVVGTGDPWLITTLRRVPRGTNGAVSPLGTLASIVGGAMIGAAHYLMNLLCLESPAPHWAPPQHCFIWLGALGGLLGSLIDSLLGATLQYSGVTPSGQVVSCPRSFVQHISGRAILSNEAVNLLSEVMTAAALPALLMMLY